jgi:DNA-binding CsgD family transcriptional regulator
MSELLPVATVKEIAERLDIRPATVATYEARLFDKLGVSNLLDLQRIADLHDHPLS